MMQKVGCAVVPAAFGRAETHIFRGWNGKIEGISYKIL